jgi:hypothetical protein
MIHIRRTFAATQCLALLLAVAWEAGGVGVAASPRNARAQQNSSRRRKRRSRTGVKMDEKAKGVRVAGTWGGAHVRLDARADGAALEFDCAHGEIVEPFATDAEGRFDLPGTYTREGPGPIRVGLPRVSRAARYGGRVEGRAMTLTVTLTDNGQTLDTFALTRGSEGHLWKCR